MTDTILINGIRAWGRHGVPPEERDAPQPFDVDVELSADLNEASLNDDLQSTIDYALIHKQIIETVQSTSYKLLERLALDILKKLFCDPRINQARVTISKPHKLSGATAFLTLQGSNPNK